MKLICLYLRNTVKFLKIWTPEKFAVITLKFEQWLYHRVMSPKGAEGMANSVDPDQTAPRSGSTLFLGAVWSGSTLFAQNYLSENLGSLR